MVNAVQGHFTGTCLTLMTFGAQPMHNRRRVHCPGAGTRVAMSSTPFESQGDID
jgi:hypothetical protein